MTQMNADFPCKDETFKIIGSCFEAYDRMGCGFLEAVYQECLSIEFGAQNILFKAQAQLPLTYRGQVLRQVYTPDFICFDKVIVEIKAVTTLADEHRAQIINCLNAGSFAVGLLINFGHYPKLEYERFVLTAGKYQRESALSAGK